MIKTILKKRWNNCPITINNNLKIVNNNSKILNNAQKIKDSIQISINCKINSIAKNKYKFILFIKYTSKILFFKTGGGHLNTPTRTQVFLLPRTDIKEKYFLAIANGKHSLQTGWFFWPGSSNTVSRRPFTGVKPTVELK